LAMIGFLRVRHSYLLDAKRVSHQRVSQ
jgi:hypothetical protein